MKIEGFVKLSALMLLFIGCVKQEPTNNIKAIGIDCAYVGNLTRCENTEVLCYYRYKTGMQCKFKGVELESPKR